MSSGLRRLLPLIALQLPTMFALEKDEGPGGGYQFPLPRKGFHFCTPCFALFFRFQIEIVLVAIMENREKAGSQLLPFNVFPTKAGGIVTLSS